MNEKLKKTTAAFEQWNSLGKNRGYASSELKEMALDLLNYYTYDQVSIAVGVSSKTIRNWEKLSSHKIRPSNFAPVILPKKAKPQKNENKCNMSPHLKLRLPNNFELSIPEQPVEKTTILISAIIREFN